MKVAFRIKVGSKDVTEKVSARLETLSVSDESGVHADRFEVTLDNREPFIEPPEIGSEIEFAIGYEQDLVEMGVFYVDEITVSRPPARMVVRASAIDFSTTIAAPIEESWHNTTFGQIAKKISKRNKLKLKIAPKLANIQIGHEDQTESDIQFLARLGVERGILITTKGRYVVASPLAPKKSISGDTLPTLTLRPEDVSTQSSILATRGDYTGVRAFFQNYRGAKKQEVEVGTRAKVLTLPYPYRRESEALAAADAKLRALRRGTRTLSLSLPGNPSFSAEQRFATDGFEDGSDGEWVANRVDHRIDSSGFITSIEAEIVDDP